METHSSKKTFEHVSYLWDEKKGSGSCWRRGRASRIYRSNLRVPIRLTNSGGGNTSCKVSSKDPLTGKSTEVMRGKGSGGDIGTLKKAARSIVYGPPARAEECVSRTPSTEDEMVELFNHCIHDLASRSSIDRHAPACIPSPSNISITFISDAGHRCRCRERWKEDLNELFNGTIGLGRMAASRFRPWFETEEVPR